MRIKDRIDQANSEAVARMIDSDPVWADVRPAIEVVLGMDKYNIFHAGLPDLWESICKLQSYTLGSQQYIGIQARLT